jgi:hypothetical protein
MGLNNIRAAFPGVAAVLGIAGLISSAPAAHAQIAYAIGNGGSSLIRFDVDSPTNASLVANFSGATSFLDAIDFRPLNGQLYGFQYQNALGTPISTLYTVDLNTAVITAVASGGNAASSFRLGMDFNPTIDRVRVVTEDGDNLVYNPNSSAAPFVADPLEYAVGDRNFGQQALVIENAYSNNLAGSTSTTQYVIDYGNGNLSTLNNNAGQLSTIGSLGVAINQSAPAVGFDIFTSLTGTNTAYAILDTTATGADARLYTVNLTTGAATSIGAVTNSAGGRFGQVYSLAVTPTVTAAAAPEPGSLALLTGVMATIGVPLYRRRRKS